MAQAIDAALTADARQHSDVDIMADFPGEASLSAADVAEQTCVDNGMAPDAHAGASLSAGFKAEAERRGRVLA